MGCLICGGELDHDFRCTYKLEPDQITETLTDNERQLFQERASQWLNKPEDVKAYLNMAALVTLQKLVKDACLPGGKDPATTSIRAINEIVKTNLDWIETKKDIESKDGAVKGSRAKVL